MKKIIIVAVIIIIALIGWYWGKDRIFTSEKEETQYRLTSVERRDMINSVSATGTLSAVTTVEVGSEVSGQISELFVDYNSLVKKDQIIARIDPEGYETLVRQAEAELDITEASLETQKTEILRYQAELENAKASFTAAQAQTRKTAVTLENARLNMERQKQLVEQDFVSKNDYDSAKTNYESALAGLEQSEAQEEAARTRITSSEVSLTIAKAKIKEAEAMVRLKQAGLDKRKVDLANTVIRSPIDGIVIDRSIDVGQTVAASLQAPVLFTIAQDLNRMQVSTSVDEADIGRIKEGQPVQFTVDAFGNRKFKGVVSQIRKLGKTVQNVVTYEVIVSADNSDLSLMPGMTADVEIELLKKPKVLTVVNAALRFKPPDDLIAETESTPGTGGGRPGMGPGARGGFGGGRRGNGPPNPETIVQGYVKRLHLNETQTEIARDLVKEMGQKMMKAFSNQTPGGPPGRGIRDSMEKIRKEFKAGMTRMLDSDQQELYEEMEKEMQASRGTLWRLNDDGKFEMIPVTIGASDPSHTEISGPGVTEGMKVVHSVR